jgi:hypothetical protein
MDEKLQGVWSFRRAGEAREEEIVEIYHDGRIAQFYKQHPSIDAYINMTMRASLEADDVFRVKTEPDAEGYLIAIRRENATLVIVNQGQHIVCRRLAECDWPTWFEEARAKAVWR